MNQHSIFLLGATILTLGVVLLGGNSYLERGLVCERKEACIKSYLDAREAETAAIRAQEDHESIISRPAAQAAIKNFGANPDDISAMSWNHQTKGEGGDLGVIEVVIIKGGPDYFYRPDSGEIALEKPFGFVYTDQD